MDGGQLITLLQYLITAVSGYAVAQLAFKGKKVDKDISDNDTIENMFRTQADLLKTYTDENKKLRDQVKELTEQVKELTTKIDVYEAERKSNTP